MTSQHAAGAPRPDGARHPLDPLSEHEIRQAVGILTGDGRVSPAMRFVSVGLREPSKGEVASFRPGRAFSREAFIVALEPREHMTYEAVVSITARAVLSWRPVPGARAPHTQGEKTE
jgi:primary-amine oxidase